MGETRLARVFDGRTPQNRPVLGPDRPPLIDAAERRQVVAFLDGGVVLLGGGPLVADALDSEHAPVVPVGYATDGTWIWGAPLRYYAERHGLAPEPELLAHIRACGYQARTPSPAEVDHAYADLQEYFRSAAG
jgi:hypothetical protein